MDSFAQRIKKLREMRGYTQKQLAEKAGIHEMSIQFYEYGTRRPKPEQLPKLAEALDVDIAYLQPTVTDTPLALLALLFDLMDEFGDIKIEQHNEGVLFGLGSEHIQENRLLTSAFYAHETLSPENFKKWLLDYPKKQ